MGLSLRGATSGAIDINAPAVAGDNTITLPGNNGAANQFYKNSGTAGIVTYSSMVETSAGRIGIGTDNPNQKLDVSGNAHFLGDMFTLEGAGIFFSGNNDYGAGVYGRNSGNDLVMNAGSAEKVRITSAGNVGIGTDNPSRKLQIAPSGSNAYDAVQIGDGLYIGNTSNNANAAVFHQGGGADLEIGSQQHITFTTGDIAGIASERMRLDSTGRLLIGATSSERMGKSTLAQVVQISANDNSAGLAMRRASNAAFGPYFAFAKANGTLASPTTVQDGDEIGFMSWGAYDGTDYRSYCASISAEIQGTVGSDSTPGKLVFGTTSAGGNTTSTRMSIDNTGLIVLPNNCPGIQFGTTGAAGLTSKTLDDYEEGTWTPTLSFGGNNTGITYATQTGAYTKIGNTVFVQIAMNVSNIGSASGDAVITLPYPVANSANWTQWESVANLYLLSGSSNWSTAVASFSDLKGGVIFAEDQLTSSIMTNTQVASAFNIRISGTYIAA